jgi:hypothetical protein
VVAGPPGLSESQASPRATGPLRAESALRSARAAGPETAPEAETRHFSRRNSAKSPRIFGAAGKFSGVATPGKSPAGPETPTETGEYSELAAAFQSVFGARTAPVFADRAAAALDTARKPESKLTVDDAWTRARIRERAETEPGASA